MEIKGTLTINDESMEHHKFCGKKDKHFIISFKLENGKELELDSCLNCESMWVDDEALLEAGIKVDDKDSRDPGSKG